VYESTLSLMLQKNKKAAEKDAKEKEQILKSYYEGIKFIDEGYYNYRLDLVEIEKSKMKDAGLDKLKIERYEQEERKKLNVDFIAWLQKEFPWLFDKNGNIVNGVTIPLNFVYGNRTGKLNEAEPVNKPKFDLGSDAQILENWIRESALAGQAMDAFVSSAIVGIDELKITVGNDATFMSRAFTNFANIALRAIEEILAKWAVLNLFAFLGGLPGVNLFSMLGLAEGGMITEPIAGVGASGQRYLLGEKGNELVIPLSKIGLLNNLASTNNKQIEHKITVEVNGNSRIDGGDIYTAWKHVDKMIKRYR
jgi:hypothetical protein